MLSTQNQQLLQQLNEALETHGLTSGGLKRSLMSKQQPDLVKRPEKEDNEERGEMEEDTLKPVSMFPFNMNNLNLRYKNIMFLDQVN